MTKTQVEVITSVQRRRSWSRAEKERIVAAAMEPGAVASEVAARLGSIPANCFVGASSCVSGPKFRRRLTWSAITPEPEAASAPAVAERAGVIEIEFATGGRMRITGTVDAPDGDGADEGAGERQAPAMIPVPSSASLACFRPH